MRPEQIAQWKTHGAVINVAAKIQNDIQVEFEGPFVISGALHLKASTVIGAYSYFQSGIVHELSSVGRYCSIGPNVVIGHEEHPVDWLSTSPFQYSARKFGYYPSLENFEFVKRTRRTDAVKNRQAPKIGHDVWLGANVVILKGVTIGHGAIIGAGAVVTKDVEPYSIVGGVPARLIRKRFSDSVIERLLALQWWRYDVKDLSGLPFNDVSKALDQLEEKVSLGLVQPREESYTVISVIKGQPVRI